MVSVNSILAEFDCTDELTRQQNAQFDLQIADAQQIVQRELQFGGAGQLDGLVAAAAVETARLCLLDGEAQIERCKLVAPYSGRIARIRMKPGQSMRAGQPMIDLAR